MNKEFKPSNESSLQTRDQRIVCKHEKLEACVAAMAKVKTTLLSRENDGDLSLVEAVSDLIRLTIDAMHDEVSIRRSRVVAMANPAVKDTLHETEPNEFLFGKNLTENLKQANILGKESQGLLKKSTSSKNPKAPPRQVQNKSQASASGGAQRHSSKSWTNSRNYRQEKTHQSPHRRTSEKQRTNYKKLSKSRN